METPNQTFVDYYRCPERFAAFTLRGDASGTSGFFRFGGAVCYGPSATGRPAADVRPDLYDALADVALEQGSLRLPFDPTQITENLRRERYVPDPQSGHGRLRHGGPLWTAYRLLRPALSVPLRIHLQRLYFRAWDKIPFPAWPVDRTVDDINERLLALTLEAHGLDEIPFIWFWPDGAPACAILTHDVETSTGLQCCSGLMDLDDSVGIKSSFQIVPKDRYPVSASRLDAIRGRGFEINIHDFNHDGQLFTNRDVFRQRAPLINRYARDFGALGFRSGSLYRKPEWFDELEFSYDMSIPSVAHLEPQRGGCCTVMPFFVGRLLELPLTTTQDYSLFHILKSYSIDLWKRQIALIVERHGLASFIVHPDYVIEKRARATYQALLRHLAQLRADRGLWIALPRDVDQWWRQRSRMTLVADGNRWRIDGAGKERARLAFATVREGKVTYRLDARP